MQVEAPPLLIANHRAIRKSRQKESSQSGDLVKAFEAEIAHVTQQHVAGAKLIEDVIGGRHIILRSHMKFGSNSLASEVVKGPALA